MTEGINNDPGPAPLPSNNPIGTRPDRPTMTNPCNEIPDPGDRWFKAETNEIGREWARDPYVAHVPSPHPMPQFEFVVLRDHPLVRCFAAGDKIDLNDYISEQNV